MVNIGSEICKPYLIINIISALVNLGKVQGTFFFVFTGAEGNRLQIYKRIKFFVFVRNGSEGGGGGGVLNLRSEHSRCGRGLPKMNKCK